MVGCNLCAQKINNFECQRLLQESEVKKLILCTCPAPRWSLGSPLSVCLASLRLLGLAPRTGPRSQRMNLTS